MKCPKPKDAQDAARQARIWERTAGMFGKEGGYYAYHQGENLWGVYKSSGSTKADTGYLVDLNKRTCTCPDFVKHRDICKHLLGLEIQLEREQQQEMDFTAEQEEEAAFMEACAIDSELRGTYGVCY